METRRPKSHFRETVGSVGHVGPVYKIPNDMAEMMDSAGASCIAASPRDDGTVDFILYMVTGGILQLYRARRVPYVGGGSKYSFSHATFPGRGIPGGESLVTFADSRASRCEVDVTFTLDVNPRSAIKREIPRIEGAGPFWHGFCDYLKAIDRQRARRTAANVA